MKIRIITKFRYEDEPELEVFTDVREMDESAFDQEEAQAMLQRLRRPGTSIIIEVIN